MDDPRGRRPGGDDLLGRRVALPLGLHALPDRRRAVADRVDGGRRCRPYDAFTPGRRAGGGGRRRLEPGGPHRGAPDAARPPLAEYRPIPPARPRQQRPLPRARR